MISWKPGSSFERGCHECTELLLVDGQPGFAFYHTSEIPGSLGFAVSASFGDGSFVIVSALAFI